MKIEEWKRGLKIGGQMGRELDFEKAKEIFLKDLRIRNYSRATLQSCLYSLKTLEAFLSKREKTNLKDVSPADWQDYVGEVYPVELGRRPTLDKPAKGFHGVNAGHWADSTKELLLTKARIFFSFLVQNQLLLFSPVEDFPKPRSYAPRPLPSTLSLHDIGRMLEGSPDQHPSTSPSASSGQRSGQHPLSLRDRAIVELLYSSGLRLGEIIRLKVTDVDLARGLAFIDRGKGNKDRMVPVGKKAIQAIREYLTQLRPRLAGPNASVPQLFVTRKGKMMEAKVVRRTLHKVARTSGITKRVYPHLFRHTMATHLLKGGAPFAIVQGILGHVQPSTTQLYTHLDKKDLSRAWRNFHPRGRWRFVSEEGKTDGARNER